jgi:hypothetical protein
MPIWTVNIQLESVRKVEPGPKQLQRNKAVILSRETVILSREAVILS